MRILLISLLVWIELISTSSAEDVIATRNLVRGNVVTVNDLKITSTNFDLANVYVGMQLRRTIYQGQKLQSTDLEKKVLVERNEIVAMAYSSGNLLITTYGRSLGRGALGEVVQIMNSRSRKKVQAIVTGPGYVEVR